MKNLRKNGLADLQLVMIIFMATVGTNIIFLPRIVAEKAGRDGWLAIGLAGLLVMVVAMFIYLLCRRFPRKVLAEFSVLILGKPLGSMVSSAYVAYTLLLGGATLRLFAEVTKTWTLFWTPRWFFVLLILVPVVYIVRQGAVPLGRFTELAWFTLLLLLPLVAVPALRFNTLHLKPVGGEGVAAIARALPEASFSYLGFEVLWVFFPLAVNRKKVFRLYFLAILAVIILFTGITALIYAVMGVDLARMQIWPLMEYLSVGRIHILDRIDNLFLFLWTFKVVSLVAVQYYAAVSTAAHLTSKGRRFGLWSLLFLPVLYTITALPENQAAAFDMAALVGRWGAAFILALVLLLLLVAIIRGLDEREDVSRP